MQNSYIKCVRVCFYAFIIIRCSTQYTQCIEGKKPLNFAKFCYRKKINFLALEYSGHGKSYGKFTDGNISSWTNDAYKVIKSRFKNLNLIIIGSSMGSWIALNLIKKFQKKVKGFIGIGSAPEFL